MKIRTVDREEFMLFLDGVLMENIRGNVVYVDENACSCAMEALDNGETIAFTQRNMIISYMSKIGDEYYENEELN